MSTYLPLDEILDHPCRQAIHQLVSARPGITYDEILASLHAVPEFPHLGHGSLSYHLYRLTRVGIITTRRSGRWRRHYLAGTPLPGGATALSVLQSLPVLRLAEIIHARPGITQREIWDEYILDRPCARQTVAYYLQRLETSGLATVAWQGRTKRYALGPVGQNLLPLLAKTRGQVCAYPVPVATGLTAAWAAAAEGGVP